MEPGGFKIQRFTTDSALDYWCYSQLMSLLLPFVLFINIRSRLVKMPTLELCAYSWLALGGALNLAFPLFLVRYHSTMQDQTRMKSAALRLPTWGLDVLGICLWLSFWLTVSLSCSKEEEVGTGCRLSRPDIRSRYISSVAVGKLLKSPERAQKRNRRILVPRVACSSYLAKRVHEKQVALGTHDLIGRI
ncbi:hypothetical protein ACROYT_G044243 [Oculina patagonica]